MKDEADPEFRERQEALKGRINRIDRESLTANPRREAFFEAVYEQADEDPAGVPWADLAAKEKLSDWLSAQSGIESPNRGRAIDVGCGLGDNAEALASAGYQTIAFDFSPKAIEWALNRFPDTSVTYQVADLFNLPGEWYQAFNLVHECYTLQSIPSETLDQTIPAVASLVAPGGTLLVYSRVVEDGIKTDGPPWPLQRSHLNSFDQHGLVLISTDEFELVRPDRAIPHLFSIWRRPI